VFRRFELVHLAGWWQFWLGQMNLEEDSETLRAVPPMVDGRTAVIVEQFFPSCWRGLLRLLDVPQVLKDRSSIVADHWKLNELLPVD
jgi:hypothetical protein